MAILRAGPFATSDNPSTGKFFQDEPDSFTESSARNTFPVNCAHDRTGTSWNWRYLAFTAEDPATGTLRNASTSAAGGDDQTSHTGSGVALDNFHSIVKYSYQASIAESKNIQYSASGFFQGVTGRKIQIQIVVDNELKFSDEASTSSAAGETLSISGTASVDMKASVVPSVVTIDLNTQDASDSYTFDINLFP
jgi:hypothetical protein